MGRGRYRGHQFGHVGEVLQIRDVVLQLHQPIGREEIAPVLPEPRPPLTGGERDHQPIGLAYHALISVLAAVAWALVVRFAWPQHIEDWADACEGDAAEQGER